MPYLELWMECKDEPKQTQREIDDKAPRASKRGQIEDNNTGTSMMKPMMDASTQGRNPVFRGD